MIADRLHHRRRSGGVVGGAGRARRGVEVRAHDDDFVGEIGTGNIRDGVDAVRRRRRLRIERRLDVQLDPHGQALLEDAQHAVVVLDGDGRRRHLLRRLGIAAAAAARENRAAVDALRLPGQIAAAGRQVAVRAAFEQCRHAFGDVELRRSCSVRPGPPPPRRRHPRAGRRRNRRRQCFLNVAARSSAGRRDPRACARGATGCGRTILPLSVPRISPSPLRCGCRRGRRRR